MTQDEKTHQANEKVIGNFAPKLLELTNNLLYGEIWKRGELSPRERSIATIAVLMTLRATEQLKFHVKRGVKNGLTPDEIAEVITHLTFYVGWPAAMNAVATTRRALGQS